MLLSNNKKVMMLGVPKTGTRSSLSVLSPYGINLLYKAPGKNEGNHITYTQCCEICEDSDFGVQGFSRVGVDKVYIFWRDPVHRFISAINYVRGVRKNRYLLRRKQEWFPSVDFTNYRNPMLGGVNEDFWLSADAAAARITPEQIFADAATLRTEHFRAQVDWYKDVPNDKLIVLDFAQFDAGLRRIAADFGAPADTPIPVVNESRKLTTTLSPELEAAVRAYYADDYALKPT